MKGPQLYQKAKRLIPGGTQLLSKRPEQFLPEIWPSYYTRAQGVEVEDLDGRVYVDMSLMGVGACILGYADPDVDAAVKTAIDLGSMCTLNAPEEVELAEVLCSLHPWAQMARYARSGGEAMAMAVRIARAHTRRDVVAFCGYHGWADWYLAANLGSEDALDGHLLPGLAPTGVPRGLQGTALPFHYNRIDQLKAIVAQHRNQLGAIVMEPQRGQDPEPGFLEEVRDIASEIGAVLIFDEITTGFRLTAGGIHLLLGVNPDLAVFAKALANGYPMAAVVGREPVMQAAQSTFISSTNWTERLGPVAALATISKYQREDVARHLIRIGTMVTEGWQAAAQETGLNLHTHGIATLNHFALEHAEELNLTTLFTQLMLERGYLAHNQFKPSFAHQPEHIEAYLQAVREVFAILAESLKSGDTASRLLGPPARRGFYRLN
jgi:glutamate-1-semialdehyde 2,1-aminomutase